MGIQFITIFGAIAVLTNAAILYPSDTETRETSNLDGIWQFVMSDIRNPSEGLVDRWYENDLSSYKKTIGMPVPSSYNDIVETPEFRDHVGTVWYERKFFVPASWSANQRVWIRFGSVHYEAQVWINGVSVITHEMGHLPFEADITEVVNFGVENRVTVLCDNSLRTTTIPHGEIVELEGDNGPIISQTFTMDFFNYAGIQRSVHLFTTPLVHITDISVVTDAINENLGRVNYVISHSTSSQVLSVFIQIRDRDDNVVQESTTENQLSGSIDIANPILWWPYLMNSNPGYLYTFEAYLQTASGDVLDVYRLKIGIRSVTWDNKQVYINGKPVYFRGFGKHEDSDIRGKGFDAPLLIKDFNLIKWIGANAYRTSHYPYSEESMQLADEYGIMVIDECNGANIEHFIPEVMEKHKSSINQLISRDKNHPSVIMWSIANEPRASQDVAGDYFRDIVAYTKSLDDRRPVTAAIYTEVYNDNMAPHLDILSFNRYNGWYRNTGRLDMIRTIVVDEGIAWNDKYDKPVLVSEYGADTQEGLHLLPSYVWSEEYQKDLFSKHFEAFDLLREKGYFIGEFIWNFSDFKTSQVYRRVGGNRKGIFTRQREPKAAAHLVRQRYFALGQEVDNLESIPDDVNPYIIVNKN